MVEQCGGGIFGYFSYVSYFLPFLTDSGLIAVGQPKMGIEMGIKMAIFSAIVWGVMMDPVIV